MATPVQTTVPRNRSIGDCLSAPRLAPYLSASNNNVKQALRLYRWNIDLSGAVYEALHVLEVFVRNAMDAEISLWNATQVDAATGRARSSDWLMDPAPLLVRLTRDDIPKASQRARIALRSGKKGGRPPMHPDVLAQLSFGTWRFLLPDKDPGRQRLWSDALCRAFPFLPGPPNDLVDQVDGIYRLRNRVAHLEPLISTGLVEKEFKAIRAVLSAIDPGVEGWLTSRQRVTTVLKSRP